MNYTLKNYLLLVVYLALPSLLISDIEITVFIEKNVITGKITINDNFLYITVTLLHVFLQYIFFIAGIFFYYALQITFFPQLLREKTGM